MELSRLSTPLVEKRGKWGMEYSRPSTLHIVKMGIPLSKGEGRVRVQHGGCKNISRPICSIYTGLEVRCKSSSRQTGSCNTILESPFRGVLIVTKSTCSYDQCTPTKWLKKVRYKNLSRKASSINAGLGVGCKKC